LDRSRTVTVLKCGRSAAVLQDDARGDAAIAPGAPVPDIIQVSARG